MSSEMVGFEKKKSERGKVVIFLLVSAIVLLAEVLLMDYCILKMPELIQMVYDRVTLPESFLFILYFKGLFQMVMIVLGIVPVAILMVLTLLGMSKLGSRSGQKDAISVS